MINKIIQGNCLDVLKILPDESVDCCVTSPPYWGLRDYGTAEWAGGDLDCKHTYKVNSPYNENFNERYGNAPGQKKQESQRHEKLYKDTCNDCGAVRIDEQIGLEKTPEEYVAKMVLVFEEVKRILKPEGTLWLNLGDSYAGSGGINGVPESWNSISMGNKNKYFENNPNRAAKSIGLKAKDLVGIPWMVAFALRSNGWYLRQDIIWSKPNPMPESVTDRCTKSHEYIFLLSKRAQYYYNHDAIKTEMYCAEHDKRSRISRKRFPTDKINGIRKSDDGLREWANKRSVWTVPTKPFAEAHFATFPEDLISDCIKAGCPEEGTVLDPFIGAGTTAVVAKKLNRNYLGIELNPKYIKIAEKRLYNEIGMFL